MKNTLILNTTIEDEFSGYTGYTRRELICKTTNLQNSRVIFEHHDNRTDVETTFVFVFTRGVCHDVYSIVDDGKTFVVRRPAGELFNDDDINLDLIEELRTQAPTFVIEYNKNDIYSDDMRDMLIEKL